MAKKLKFTKNKVTIYKYDGVWWVTIAHGDLVGVFDCIDFKRALAFGLQRANLSKMEL